MCAILTVIIKGTVFSSSSMKVYEVSCLSIFPCGRGCVSHVVLRGDNGDIVNDSVYNVYISNYITGYHHNNEI